MCVWFLLSWWEYTPARLPLPVWHLEPEQPQFCSCIRLVCAPSSLSDSASLPCPAGSACGIGTGFGNVTLLACALGSFCPNGTQFPTQYPCPPGTFTASRFLTSSSQCTTCYPGSFCSGGGSAVSGACAAGYFCPNATAFPTQYPCLAGTFSTLTNLTDARECWACPPGKFCPQATSVPINCPAGTFTNNVSTQTNGPGPYPACQLCPAGSFCITGSIDPIICSPSTFSGAGASSCSSCQAGYYCPENGTTNAKMLSTFLCPQGQFCPPGVSVIPSLATHSCPLGYYCPQATTAPIACPAGYYMDATGAERLSDCKLCPGGHFCPPNSTHYLQRICSPGYFCPNGSSSAQQQQCPGGTFRPNSLGALLNDCSVCPAGFYCPAASQTPSTCPQGFFCLANVAIPSPCPVGTFGNRTGLQQSSECSQCTGGYYCATTGITSPTGLCGAGFYCPEGIPTSAPPTFVCTAGSYCPLGSSLPIACPSGTFNNLTGSVSLAACRACSPGQFCAGLRNIAPTGPCTSGYFCNGSASTPNPNDNVTGAICPLGSFCTVASSRHTLCPPGSYSPSLGLAACIPCPAGSLCASSGMIAPGTCPIGFYCPENSSNPTGCPFGTIGNRTGLISITECTPCPPSSYCSGTGLATPSGLCSAGYFCQSGANMSAPMNQVGASVCPAGFFCPIGTSSPVVCPAGSFCGGGNSGPVVCPAGTYSDVSGLSVCKTCPRGRFCRLNTTSLVQSDCPAGYFCPAGIASYVNFTCLAGTFSNQTSLGDVSECSSCPGGMFCGGSALVSPSGQCSAGFYCAGGASVSNPQDGVTGNVCPRGSYCPSGSRYPVPCVRGRFCGNVGMTAPGASCSAGYICIENATTSMPVDGVSGFVCPAGSFCMSGALSPVSCPSGTWSNRTGLGSMDECEICPPGRFCPTSGMTQPGPLCTAGYYCPGGRDEPSNSSLLCSAGYYCPMGSGVSTQVACPAGTFRGAVGGASVVDCAVCPAGMVCVIGTAVPVVCPIGSYCPPGTQSSLQFRCPVGTFGASLGLSTLSSCSACLAGMACTASGLSQPDVSCSAGYFCLGGAASSTPLDGITGNVCPMGHYCPINSMSPVPCPAGSFSPNTGNRNMSDCQNLPVGLFSTSSAVVSISNCSSAICGNTSLTSCQPNVNGFCSLSAVSAGSCDEGFVCSGGSNTPRPTTSGGYICPKGALCLRGALSPTSCPSGLYNPSFAQTSCLVCSMYYCCSHII